MCRGQRPVEHLRSEEKRCFNVKVRVCLGNYYLTKRNKKSLSFYDNKIVREEMLGLILVLLSVKLITIGFLEGFTILKVFN